MPSKRRAWSRKLGFLPAAYLLASCVSGTTGGIEPDRGDPAAEITPLPQQGQAADFGKIRSEVDKFTNRGPNRAHSRESCPGCVPVSVEIQSIGNTTKINPLAVLARPRVIGRLQNNGGKDELRYGLKNGTEYLIYLEPKQGAAGATLSLFELPKSGVGYANRIDLGEIRVCHTYTASDHHSDTDFRDYSECTPPAPTAALQKPAGAGGPGPSLVPPLFGKLAREERTVLTATSGVWFECDPGCCVGSRIGT